MTERLSICADENDNMRSVDYDDTHFSSDRAKFGDPYMMKKGAVLGLNMIREMAGIPIFVNCGYELSGHKSGSQHEFGTAIDWHWDLSRMNLFQMFLLVYESRLFSGIGIYPDWNNPGLHTDIGHENFTTWIRLNGAYYSINQMIMESPEHFPK